MENTQQIIDRIESYCATHNISTTSFGRRVTNDGKMVGRLKAGGTMQLPTYDLIMLQLTLPPKQSARAVMAARKAAKAKVALEQAAEQRPAAE